MAIATTQVIGGVAPQEVKQGGAAPSGPHTPAPAGSTPASATPPPENTEAAGKTVEVDIKPEELKGFTALSKQLREARAALKAAEEKLSAAPAPVADPKAAELAEMVKAGKHLAAARAAGIDIDAAVQEHLAADDPKPAQDPRVDELLKERAEEKAREEAEKKAQDEADTKAATEAAEAARADAGVHVKTLLAAEPTKWARVAKDGDEGIADVLGSAEAAVRALGRAVTDEEAAGIFAAALDKAETYRREKAALWAVGEQPGPREVKPGRGLEVREIDPGAGRPPSPTIGAERSSTRAAPPEIRQMSAREARREMNEFFKRNRQQRPS